MRNAIDVSILLGYRPPGPVSVGMLCQREDRMRLSTLTFAAVCLTACSNGPTVNGDVNAVVDGVVWMTGPVAGVVVSAYNLDLTTGTQGGLVAQSKPTSEAGAYHIDLGNHIGPLLLMAKGVGGTYVEPATGVTVNWDSSTQLRAVYVTWTLGFDLKFDIESGDAVVANLSPWSEWATAYAGGRLQSHRESKYTDALKSAIFRFRDHVELDFWNVAPVVLSDKTVGAWNNQIQAGVAHAALSALTLRMARESQISTAGLSSLQLLAAVRDDLTDPMAVLDGVGIQGAWKIGTCTTVCALSPRTLRANLSEAAADFLGSSANKSGIRVTDAQQFLAHISARMSDLWPAGGDANFDTQPPTVAVMGLQEADILHGTVTATVRASDAIEMGSVVLTFSRGGTPVANFYAAAPSSPDAQTRLIALTLRTVELADGPLLLRIDATDKAGNKMVPVELSLFLDNSPSGSIAGTVVLGGRLAGARVQAWEYGAGQKGKLLGQAVTGVGGIYKVDVMDTTAAAILIEVGNPPGQPAAQYIEGTSGWMVGLSIDDRLETILTGWRNGDKRPDGMVTPWTAMAVALARGLFASPLYNMNAAQWSAAVDEAYGHLENHLFTETTRVSLRSDQPADLTAPGTDTFNSQARYGLMIHALGQLADQQARMSSTTSASMNTLSLTKLLVQDLAEDGRGVAPFFNGRTGSGQLVHGRVNLTSYETRVNLAVAAVDFMTNNTRYKAPFIQLDVAPLLDRISADDNMRLYPASEPPLPYDTVKPDSVTFTANTFAEGNVVRGDITIEATAHDNRALASFVWTAPTGTGVITGLRLDPTAGLAGPWILGGVLHTDLFPEGGVVVSARAVDQATNAAFTSRTFTIDRTPPIVTLASAVTASGGALAAGGWTGATTLTVKGTIAEPHLASASYAVNGNSAPLQVGADGAWTVSIPMAATGPYTLGVSATDAAGNAAPPLNVVFNCDVSAPTINVLASTFVDDTGRTANVKGAGVGVVEFGSSGATVTLAAGATPSFAKFTDLYSATMDRLPTWRFMAVDNHSQENQLTFDVRLSRRPAEGSSVLLKDWFAVDGVGTGFNHSLTISAGLHPDIGLVSGTYVLEYRSKDEFGNLSSVDCAHGIGCVQWVQQILAPPLRQRAGTDADLCDSTIPTGHSLRSGGPCPSLDYTAGANLNASRKIAYGFVDNPNALPVHFVVLASSPSMIRRGIKDVNPIVADPSDVKFGCDGIGVADENLDGSCYTASSHTDEYGTQEVLDRELAAGVSVTGATAVATDATGRQIYEIAPRQTATVWILSNPWRFLMAKSAKDYSSIGSLAHVTGYTGKDWLQCTGELAGDELTCANQVQRREVTFLTRVLVKPATSVSLLARSAGGGDAVFHAAVGTNVMSFAYANFIWASEVAGYNPFE